MHCSTVLDRLIPDLVPCKTIVEYGIEVRHFKHLIDILRWCINGLLNAIGHRRRWKSMRTLNQ